MPPSGDDARRIVFDGYDVIADRYEEAFGQSAVRDRYLRILMSDLPARANVLDLGCGNGLPTVARLASAGNTVVGVDGSIAQVLRARRNVPAASIVHGDISSIDLAYNHFDAVSAFYVLNHLPRNEHGPLLRRIHRWLRPGGRFVGSFGVDEGDWTEEWLGHPMYFSANSRMTTEALIDEAGLELISGEVLQQDNEDARFLWIVTRKNLPCRPENARGARP